MNLGGKSRERLWLLGLLAALALVVGGPVSEAYAQQGIAQNLEDSFELHGYVENKEIIRAENYVSDYNVASIRNRIDLQPSGQIIKDATLPTVVGVPLGTGLSVNYFAELRPGYEGVYDLVTDRFGNHTTGFSGIGVSEFQGTQQTAGFGLLNEFGYHPKEFKG